jgi:hypothetical protein
MMRALHFILVIPVAEDYSPTEARPCARRRSSFGLPTEESWVDGNSDRAFNRRRLFRRSVASEFAEGPADREGPCAPMDKALGGDLGLI